jgi:hypothetical protein
VLAHTDFSVASKLELRLMLAGEPGRVVGRRGQAWGLELRREPARGSLGAVSDAVQAVLGPVRLLRRGRRVLAVARR